MKQCFITGTCTDHLTYISKVENNKHHCYKNDTPSPLEEQVEFKILMTVFRSHQSGSINVLG